MFSVLYEIGPWSQGWKGGGELFEKTNLVRSFTGRVSCFSCSDSGAQVTVEEEKKGDVSKVASVTEKYFECVAKCHGEHADCTKKLKCALKSTKEDDEKVDKALQACNTSTGLNAAKDPGHADCECLKKAGVE
jgi:hypothetical protein